MKTNKIDGFEVGQNVSIIVVKNSNAWRSVKDNGKPRLFNAIITKIGKKYITAETQNGDYVFDFFTYFFS